MALNDIELNAVLYYADYLSIRDKNIPVTDSPKYFFIYHTPINIAYLSGIMPTYDESNKFFRQALREYKLIKDKFDESGITSFIEDICSIQACGVVDWKRILTYCMQYSTKSEKAEAFKKCGNYINNRKYKHEIKNNDNEPVE